MSDEKLEGVALFRSFLTFYPRHPLACEAQLKIVAYHHKRMRSPERDQSETHQTVEEARRLLATYPDCPHADEARRLLQEALDRLAMSEFKVGEFYFKTGRIRAACHRFEDLLQQYADFSMRDKVQYYLYQSYQKLGKLTEAEELRQKLAAEQPDSEYLRKMD
jgi:outer membrane assembly lipoprotein YfiO